uniref:Uncharacterized protein n=1 Tax=Aegilops tauschii subsp. strangulata TaxID=200361 RepID=A0A452ZZ80_AEGTS
CAQRANHPEYCTGAVGGIAAVDGIGRPGEAYKYIQVTPAPNPSPTTPGRSSSREPAALRSPQRPETDTMAAPTSSAASTLAPFSH